MSRACPKTIQSSPSSQAQASRLTTDCPWPLALLPPVRNCNCNPIANSTTNNHQLNHQLKSSTQRPTPSSTAIQTAFSAFAAAVAKLLAYTAEAERRQTALEAAPATSAALARLLLLGVVHLVLRRIVALGRGARVRLPAGVAVSTSVCGPQRSGSSTRRSALTAWGYWG